MAYKPVNATLVPLELISVAKIASHAQLIVKHVQVELCAKLVRQDMDYKLINALPALLEPI